MLIGKVEGGTITENDRLVIMPHGLVVGVNKIFKDSKNKID